MLSIEEAHRLLNEGGDKYTDGEVEQIRDEYQILRKSSLRVG